MSLGNVIEILLAVSCIGSFVWSTLRFFTRSRTDNRQQRRSLLIVGLVSATQLAALFGWNNSVPLLSVIGAALYLCSLTIFWWTIRTLGQRGLGLFFDVAGPDRLVVTGPYRYIRHPFYTSYLCCWIAGVCATGAVWLSITVIVAGTIYWRAASAEEQTFLDSPMGTAYRTYQQQTGMFLPRVIAS